MRSMIIISVLFAIITSCHSNKQQGEQLPQFEILLPDSVTRLNTANIAAGKPVILLYFSPDCEHCQDETKSLIHAIDSLKDTQIYFVTNEPFEGMKTFNAYFHLGKYPNIKIGRDEQFFMIRHFKGIYPPYILIYDKDLRQRAAIMGEKKPNELVKIIDSL